MRDGVLRNRPSTERRLREVGEALEVLVRIDDAWLWEFQRRREASPTPDGLPGNTRLGRDHGASTSIAHVLDCPTATNPHPNCECGEVEMTSVERAASIRRPGCERPLFSKVEGVKEPYCVRCGRRKRDHLADPIGATVEHVFELLDQATTALRTLGRRADVVLHAADAYRGRQSETSQCLTCGRDVPGEGADARKGERLRAGYCPACHTAWLRWCRKRDDDGLDASPVVFRWERKNERQQRERAAASA